MPPSLLRRLGVLAAVTVLVVAVSPVGAQEPDPDDTTSTTESTTTTTTEPPLPPPEEPPVVPPPPPPPPPPPGEPPPEQPPPPPADQGGDQDSPPEEVPDWDGEVPPAPGEPVDGAAAERIIQRELRVAKAEALQSEAEVADAARLVDDLASRLVELQRQLARLDVAQQLAVQELEAAEVRFRDRIANAVVRGNAAELDTIITATDATDLEMRKVFLTSVSEADRASVTDLQQAKAVIDDGVLAALDDLARTRRELRSARQGLQDALRVNTEHKFQLAVFSAGSQIVIRGFVFPVARPYSFIDSWGYPRMVGTEYEHGHQGVDIMADFGTPLYAVERGIITRVGVDVLGGTKLWLKGQSGTHYYYAHLAAYADGMVEGALVNAGDVVGYVGDTGNARGGAPHLHFQVHPGGGQAVNPYGLLKVVADLSR